MKFKYLSPNTVKLIKSTRIKYQTLPLLTFLVVIFTMTSSICLIDLDVINDVIPHPVILLLPWVFLSLLLGFLAARYTSETIIRKLKAVVGNEEAYDLMRDYSSTYLYFLDFINRDKK